jgi:hypothetical protein
MKRSNAPTLDSRVAFSLRRAWALTLSLQKSGCPASRSISAIRERFRSTSKVPPERLQALPQVGDLLGAGIRHDRNFL